MPDRQWSKPGSLSQGIRPELLKTPCRMGCWGTAAEPEHLRAGTLTSATLRSAGRDQLAVDRECKEPMKYFEQASYRPEGRGRTYRRARILTVAGMRPFPK